MQLFAGPLMDVDGATKLLLGIIRTLGSNEDPGQPTMRVCQEMPTLQFLWCVDCEPLKGVDRTAERMLDIRWPQGECRVAERMPEGLAGLDIIGRLLNQSTLQRNRLLER